MVAPPEIVRRSLSAYTDIQEIGEGSFSVVYSAREREGRQRIFAIKTCFKRQILKEKKVALVQREKAVLARLSSLSPPHPLVVSLAATLQDAEHLYFVLSFAEKGDLLHMMLRQPGGRLTPPQALFYSAELLSALIHIHSHGIVHRDVKPENVLIRESGHILLSDFGSCKDLKEKPVAATIEEVGDKGKEEREEEDSDEDEKKIRRRARLRMRRSSFVGTAQYVTPEVLTGAEVTPSVDYWAFGVVLFQFLTGKHAFHDEAEFLMYRRIQKLLYSFPTDFSSSTAKDLISKLLVIRVEDRLGSAETGGAAAIQNHPFFRENKIPWQDITSMLPPTSL